MPKLPRKELAHRADQLGLTLYPLAESGYALLEQDDDGNPDFAKKALPKGTAAQVDAFLAGVMWHHGRES